MNKQLVECGNNIKSSCICAEYTKPSPLRKQNSAPSPMKNQILCLQRPANDKLNLVWQCLKICLKHNKRSIKSHGTSRPILICNLASFLQMWTFTEKNLVQNQSYVHWSCFRAPILLHFGGRSRCFLSYLQRINQLLYCLLIDYVKGLIDSNNRDSADRAGQFFTL